MNNNNFNISIHNKWKKLSKKECLELIKKDLLRLYPRVSYENYEYSFITYHITEKLIWIEIVFNQSPLQIRSIDPRLFNDIKKFFIEDVLDENYIDLYRKKNSKKFNEFLIKNYNEKSSNILDYYTKYPSNYKVKDFQRIKKEETDDIINQIYHAYMILDEKKDDDNLIRYKRALKNMHRDIEWIIEHPNFEMSFEFNLKKKIY